MAEPALSIVELPVVFDLDALDEVRDRIVEALEAGPVGISGKAVERVSTNALLMLLSAAGAVRTGGPRMEMMDMSRAMESAIERLGFGPYFASLAGT